MKLKNLNEVNESLNKFVGKDYKHYFIIEHPTWDTQYIYNDIYYCCESEISHGGYISVASMVYDNELDALVEQLKELFSLPVYEWQKVKVEYVQ